jgi:hypothetical protein
MTDLSNRAVVQPACFSFTLPLGAEPASESVGCLCQTSRRPGIPKGYPAQTQSWQSKEECDHQSGYAEVVVEGQRQRRCRGPGQQSRQHRARPTHAAAVPALHSCRFRHFSRAQGMFIMSGHA